jgi:hypothetical protein
MTKRDGSCRRYTFLATGTLANFFSGIVCPQAVASPTGIVPEWTRPCRAKCPPVPAAKPHKMSLSAMTRQSLEGET